jgi:hypothetical protein
MPTIVQQMILAVQPIAAHRHPGESPVGQVGNLRPIGNRPGAGTDNLPTPVTVPRSTRPLTWPLRWTGDL